MFINHLRCIESLLIILKSQLASQQTDRQTAGSICHLTSSSAATTQRIPHQASSLLDKWSEISTLFLVPLLCLDVVPFATCHELAASMVIITDKTNLKIQKYNCNERRLQSNTLPRYVLLLLLHGSWNNKLLFHLYYEYCTLTTWKRVTVFVAEKRSAYTQTQRTHLSFKLKETNNC